MSGVSAARGRSVGAALLFVLGFALVFTALGAAASGIGSLLWQQRLVMERIAGVVIVLLGLFVLGLIRPRAMEREGRPLLSRVRPGPSGALLLGMAFAAGWTPCIGPILGGILVLAYNQATLGSGIALLLLYSLGLGIPFVLAASFVDRFQGVAGWLSRRAVVLNAAGGVLLIGMGALVFFDRLNQVLAPALEMYTRLRWPPI